MGQPRDVDAMRQDCRMDDIKCKKCDILFFLEHPPLEIFFAKRSLLFVSKTEAVVAGQPHP